MAQTVTREELEARVGEPLGVSDWFLVDQDRVNASPTSRSTTNSSMSTSSAR